MPLPLILGIAAAVAGTIGVGAGIKGAVDMADANDTLNAAKKRNEKNLARHKNVDEESCKTMDALGRLEMTVLSSFKRYSDLIEQIKNRPSFAAINNDFKLPKFDEQELKDASIGAAVLVGGLGGAALGTAGAFAASGATTAAVMALGTASTGTAISTLSGAAATNAALAALGGGSLATGGGGMALGSAVLGGATLGVGLLVGGVIFSLVGSNISSKADEAYSQMLKNEKLIDKICDYLKALDKTAKAYMDDINKAFNIYNSWMTKLEGVIIRNQNWDHSTQTLVVDWNKLSELDKLVVKNTTLLVGLLYHMCKVKLVNKAADNSEINTVNYRAVEEAQTKCNETLKAVA